MSGAPGMTSSAWMPVGSAERPRLAAEGRDALGNLDIGVGHAHVVDDTLMRRTVTPAARMSTAGGCSSIPGSSAMACARRALSANEAVRKKMQPPSR